MAIGDQELARLLDLARLELSPAEADEVRADLERILAYVDELRGVDVEGLEPLVRPIDLRDVLREDETRESLPREAVEALAPATEDGFVRVPRTVDEGN